jgi:hypothetical protein
MMRLTAEFSTYITQIFILLFMVHANTVGSSGYMP